MNHLTQWAAALLTTLALAGCGDGGGGSGTALMGGSTGNTTGSATTTATAVASDLLVTVPSISIANSVSNSLTVTATAVDGNRNALANIPVTLSVDNGGVITPSGTVTTTGGTLTGTLKIGADQTNRTLQVTARSGSVVRVVQVAVTGSRLSVTGSASSVAAGSTNNLSYFLADNTGTKMVGYPITVTAGTTTRSGVTDADGYFSFSYVAPSTTGSLSITASAGGTSDTQTVTIAGASSVPADASTVVSASVTASPSVVAVNDVGSQTNKAEVRALFLGANNAPVQNVRVWFDLAGDANSIKGTLATTAAGKLVYSDANGVVRTTYAPSTRSSPKDGVTVRACWSRTEFDPATACPNVALTTLTVSSDSLSVSIGSDGKLSTGTADLTYVQRFLVSVVDVAGRAKVGVEISPSLDVSRYYKGFYTKGSDSWVQTGSGGTFVSVGGATTSFLGATPCENEDLNRNGVVEDGLNSISSAQEAVVAAASSIGSAERARIRGVNEDQNGSLNLSPGRPALDPRKADIVLSSVSGSFITDANGQVVLKIEYAKNLGSWLRYNLLVSASGVSGTEGRANYEDDVGVVAADANNLSASPPFANSPYGLGSSYVWQRTHVQGQTGWLCSNPN